MFVNLRFTYKDRRLVMTNRKELMGLAFILSSLQLFQVKTLSAFVLDDLSRLFK